MADKAKRYDRGIRVWGTHGQEALEGARVCLLNAGPTGTEALKSLVLGGIHSFTIVDGAKVAPADLGNNFLLTADALARSRAQCATGGLGGGVGRGMGRGLGRNGRAWLGGRLLEVWVAGGHGGTRAPLPRAAMQHPLPGPRCSRRRPLRPPLVRQSA